MEELLLVKLQVSAYNITKRKNSSMVVFMFFKLYKCYQIVLDWDWLKFKRNLIIFLGWKTIALLYVPLQ